MPGTEEYRILTQNFSVQQFLADSNFAEDGGSRGGIKSKSTRLITGISFMARAQLELIETSRMDDGMAAHGRAACFQLPKNVEVRREKESFAVGVVDVFGLDEEGTAGLVSFLNTSKIEAGANEFSQSTSWESNKAER